jgi:hypothetical protein
MIEPCKFPERRGASGGTIIDGGDRLVRNPDYVRIVIVLAVQKLNAVTALVMPQRHPRTRIPEKLVHFVQGMEAAEQMCDMLFHMEGAL